MKHIAETRHPGSRNLGVVGMHFKEYCSSLWEREQEPGRTWSTCKNRYKPVIFVGLDCNWQLAV